MSGRLRLSPVAGVVFVLVLGLPACGASSAVQPAAAPEVVVAVDEPGAEAAAAAASSHVSAEPALGAAEAPDKAKKVSQLEQLELQLLGALDSSGVTAGSVLSADSVGLLDAMAASSAGVGGVGGLQVGGGGGGAVRAGSGGGGLAGIGGVPGAAATAPSAPAGPKATVSVLIESTKGGAVSNAASVIAGTAAGMRRCYNRELAQNPAATAGAVRFDVKIGPNGEVLSAQPGSTSGVAGAVVSCAGARLASAQFSPPGGGSAELGVRVVFDKQQP